MEMWGSRAVDIDKTGKVPADTCLRSENRARSVSLPRVKKDRTYCLIKYGMDANCECVSAVSRVEYHDDWKACHILGAQFMSYRWIEADKEVGPPRHPAAKSAWFT